MAQYKVPQDVEADDKLLGPFNFRQFVYLLICGGLIAVGLFQLFPVLAIIPLPFVLFFGALALPLKKDQPMETYLAAVLSFYTKPRKRVWTPGQRGTTIVVTAPKVVEDSRVRDLSEEEATHRLSFLADIVDTEGYAIKGVSPVREELRAEAKMTNDMFETKHFDNLADTINKDESERHEEVIRDMQDALKETVRRNARAALIHEAPKEPDYKGDLLSSDVVVNPVGGKKEVGGSSVPAENVAREAPLAVAMPEASQQSEKKVETKSENPSIIELANNSDYSVATIAKEAKRIKNRKDEGEVFISLH